MLGESCWISEQPCIERDRYFGRCRQRCVSSDRSGLVKGISYRQNRKHLDVVIRLDRIKEYK